MFEDHDHTPDLNTINDEIHALVLRFREYEHNINLQQHAMQSVKDRLEVLLQLRGSSWSDGFGYARLSPDNAVCEYDSKALDHLILSDPVHYAWLNQYRKDDGDAPIQIR